MKGLETGKNGENIKIKYKWFMFIWDEVEFEQKAFYVVKGVRNALAQPLGAS